MLPKQFLGENVRKSETFKINELSGDSKCQRKNYKNNLRQSTDKYSRT